VNLWATRRELCRTEFPMLDRFQGALGANITVTAILTGRGDPTQVQSYLSGLGIGDRMSSGLYVSIMGLQFLGRRVAFLR